ncbi:hypothetical protein [Texcoconibacillus texcoconensis]|uniref:Uncharacterized protein n=1 Tax=Texcoconibacillus texcoconensis TaxID=1095777 RepID=A0A840QNA1_9BACI|nr:hypothetical protein [Texcoconibacillus texcoconensis]MBB5172849.1 hypothetical protein [Texcoconibacillus texcoconensis]
MLQATIFAITMFIGWTIFDLIKYRKWTKENIITGFVTSVISGIAWYILFIVF